MCFKTPSAPAAPAPLPPVPTEQDPAVSDSQARERRRQAAAMGRQSTFLTGGAGLTAPAAPASKTLLGM